MRTEQIWIGKQLGRTLLSIPLALIVTAAFYSVTGIALLESFGGIPGGVILIFVLWTTSAGILALCRKLDGADWLEAIGAGLLWAFLLVAIPACGILAWIIYSLLTGPSLSI